MFAACCEVNPDFPTHENLWRFKNFAAYTNTTRQTHATSAELTRTADVEEEDFMTAMCLRKTRPERELHVALKPFDLETPLLYCEGCARPGSNPFRHSPCIQGTQRWRNRSRTGARWVLRTGRSAKAQAEAQKLPQKGKDSGTESKGGASLTLAFDLSLV